MNDLMRIDGSSLTMSSVEIAELTLKKHKNVLTDIRLMLVNLGLRLADFSAVYKDQQLIERPCFNLPKRETLILVTGYDVKMRARVVDRWQELEAKKPIDVLAALSDPVYLRTLLLDHVEQNIALKNTVALQAPKVEALDRIATKTDGSLCITDAAKALQIQPKVLIKWLQEHHWIYRRVGGSGLKAYQDKLQTLVLEHKITTIEGADGKPRVFEQVLVTAKGLTRLSEVFCKKQRDLPLDIAA